MHYFISHRPVMYVPVHRNVMYVHIELGETKGAARIRCELWKKRRRLLVIVMVFLTFIVSGLFYNALYFVYETRQPVQGLSLTLQF